METLFYLIKSASLEIQTGEIDSFCTSSVYVLIVLLVLLKNSFTIRGSTEFKTLAALR